ncbi:nuclear transport factor 2 family protein [Nocardiopsis dassonvillei]|uniref:nuclear transport factor 2 family protein n=1 Tax=Nocardiopsis dassonvillei TaxID=2014 RepID=UPI00200F202D|nr:nuclear transport factor 2 family protein [Nocardiopsis dassonvillei]MCK9868913.1 nuclear transport factor 2 family protein [Nocardiopsis dassonvillei]
MTRTHETRPHDAELRRLLDRAEISEVQTRYATGTDSRDWELFRGCFTDEVEADFSEGFGQPVIRFQSALAGEDVPSGARA